jgi:CheY-like chemotaxis protein
VIVENHEDDVFIFCRLLEKAGLRTEPRVFHQAEEALTYLGALAADADGKALPAAVFMDVGMPGVNGFELLTWLRKQPTLESLPAVMMSGSDEPRDLGKAIRLGADCYCVKFPPPSAMREILTEIEKPRVAGAARAPLPVSCNLLLTVHPV